MRKFLTLIAFLLLAVAVSACQPTGDTSEDAASAQNVQPNISGYTVTTSDSLEDAITAAAGAAALSGGNVPLAAGIARAETVLQCMKDAGAADARAYVQQNPDGVVPQAGASLIVNKTRFNRNLVACLTTTGGEMSAQAVVIEPCTGSGEFNFLDEEFSYLYIGVGDDICAHFNNHFASMERDSSSR